MLHMNKLMINWLELVDTHTSSYLEIQTNYFYNSNTLFGWMCK